MYPSRITHEDMKTQPKAVLQKLKTRKLDPNSAEAREMVEEVAERVLRDLFPGQDSRYFPDLQLTKEKASRV